MGERTGWMRLTGSHRTRNVRQGLQARIADPLWMLCRQWQFGEFKGDDAATPVKVRVRFKSLAIEQLQTWNPDGSAGPTRSIAANELLESSVEREPVMSGPAALRLSAEAGVQFLRKLPAARRTGALRFLRIAYPLSKPDSSNQGKQRLLRLLAERSFDAQRFFRYGSTILAQLALSAGIDFELLRTAFGHWRLYYENRFAEPAAEESSWQQERLEYRFGVSTNMSLATAVHLTAEEYSGGRLDWHQFDLSPADSKGLDKGTTKNEELWLVPTPIEYSGMPADRFWNFEDGQVFFGGLSAEATDLAQLILTEFATVYSNDWFMLPVPVSTGTVTRITKVEVLDCFGKRHAIEPAAVNDGGDRVWRFFELTGDTSAESGFSPWLYVPRTILGGHQDRPVEQVVFTRDEMANLAWGIEEIVEGQSGHRVARRASWLRRRSEMDAYISKYGDEDAYEQQLKSPTNGEANSESEEPVEPPWKYRLITTVPPYWVPFVPEVRKNKTTNRLLRARMGEWDLLGEHKRELAGAQGLILQPTAPMAVQEEEIPRGAIEVTRSYQAARDPDGNLIVWVGRKKRPASGNRSSGRETDKVQIPRKKTKATE